MAAPDDTTAPSAPDDDDAERRVTPFSDGHTRKLQRAGRFAGLGYPIAWIASRFGVAEATVRLWQREPAFLDGYTTAEGQAARDAALALSKIALSLPQLVDTSLAVALDASHKDSSVERRYLIDKVLIPMTAQHSTVEHTVGQRFWEPVAAALTRVAKLAPVDIPVLVEGERAAAEYGAPTTPAAEGLPAPPTQLCVTTPEGEPGAG